MFMWVTFWHLHFLFGATNRGFGVGRGHKFTLKATTKSPDSAFAIAKGAMQKPYETHAEAMKKVRSE